MTIGPPSSCLSTFVRRLSVMLGFVPGFDLRLVGTVHALLLGVAVWLIVRAFPGPRPLRALTASLLVLALTDTRFIVYYNSFFTEPASLLALLFLIAIILHSCRRPTFTRMALFAFTAAAVALVVSKLQNAVLVVPLAFVLLARRTEWRRLHLVGRWRGRIPGAVCVGLLVS